MFAVFVSLLATLPEPAPPVIAQAADDATPEFTFAIVGAKVFDGEAFLPEQDVWVENGLVRGVGQKLDLPADLPRIGGNGRTLVPGLIDGHVHTFGSTLNDAVRFGVTTVLDQFTDPRLAASKRAARDTLARGNEADLFSAGMLATAASGHGTQYGIPVEPLDGPDDAPAWVRARKAEGSDWIKIVHEDCSTFGRDIATLDRDTIGALISAAHEEGLRAVVHVSTLAHALEAAALGADGLVHVWRDAIIDDLGGRAHRRFGCVRRPNAVGQRFHRQRCDGVGTDRGRRRHAAVGHAAPDNGQPFLRRERRDDLECRRRSDRERAPPA